MSVMKSLQRALLAIGLAGALASVAVLGQALWSFNALDLSARKAMVAKDVVADILPPPMYLIEMRLVLSEAVEQSMPLAKADSELARLQKEYEDRVQYWTANPPFGLETHLLGAQHRAAQTFMAAARSEVLDKLKAGDLPGAQAGLHRADELYLAHRHEVDGTVAAGLQLAESSLTDFAQAQHQGLLTMIGVAIGLLVTTLLIYRAAARSIVNPIEQCADHALAVSQGDLTRAVVVDRGDAIGRLQQALANMSAQLARIVGEVHSGVEQIASAGSEIAQGNGDLSARTEAQASNLQQTAASMEQIAGSVRSAAQSAQHANDRAGKALGVAGDSGETMARLATTMHGIREASAKIGNIIAVIDGIAFQTNILALNAAVEAARAGEQGRGFAVVAGEVRALAQRSAEAAKEIKTLIGESSERVEAGHTIAASAGQAIDDMVAQVREVAELVTQISRASSEQSAGMEQINQAVSHLDGATQQNAALVEETAAAAESLSQHAHRVAESMGWFKLRGSANTYA